MAGLPTARTALLLFTLMALAACQPGQNPFARKDKPEGAAAPTAATSVTLVDRDVEAPEVFQVTEQALWDGRPSLGGVWVASPDATDPERVILRNPANGKFVIGALFRRGGGGERGHGADELRRGQLSAAGGFAAGGGGAGRVDVGGAGAGGDGAAT